MMFDDHLIGTEGMLSNLQCRIGSFENPKVPCNFLLLSELSTTPTF